MAENLRAFKVMYFGPRKGKGARVKIHDLRNHAYKWIPFNSRHNHSWETAIDYLQSLGISVQYRSEVLSPEGFTKGFLLLSDNFTIELQ